VTVLLGLVGAAACSERTDPPETVDSLREQSSTLRDRERLRIGVRDDLPLVSHRDPATREYSGFEIEIAKSVAQELGYQEDRIDWIPITNLPERLTVIANGTADMVVANISITEEREKDVAFAGPYQLVPQAVMVPRNRTKPLETIADLRVEGVRVCTTTGSTSENALAGHRIETEPVDAHRQCMEGMRSGRYDAYSTDLPILAGFLGETDAGTEAFEILELAVAERAERIGIAVPKGDRAMRDLIAYFLDRWRSGPEGANPWLLAYDRTIGPLLDPKHRAQPLVDGVPELADFDSRAPGR
jgi:glutamate transport system substrate-binding protein